MTDSNAIGLLGGSFNPPHLAHIALAQAAQQQLKLQRVDLMPAGQPWQKLNSDIANAAHRLAMCRLAVEGIEHLAIEPCETERSGNTYTVDTVRALRAAHPDRRYVLLVGADQANRFDTWHDWQHILQLCTLAVANRAGQDVQLPERVRAFVAQYGLEVKKVQLPAINISATDLRRRFARGENCTTDVSPSVARYISEHSLYKTYKTYKT
jgi:nicotinate-nucleotide adenylyltransferase